MLKSVQWDIYTILMAALVPILLVSAWGLHTWDSRQLHRVQCEMAVDWLESSTAISRQFTEAGTMGRIQFWITGLEAFDSPSAAGDLRWGILQSARYNATYNRNLATTEPGVLNPRNGLFERQIEEGRQQLVEHCPETQELIPAAFPMVFREDVS